MKTRTEIKISSTFPTIHQNDCFLTLGSCFANQMAEFLSKSKFSVVNNPTGINYNPMSLSKTVNLMVQNRQIDEEELHQNDDLYCHFDFHSDFSAVAESVALQKMNKSLQIAHQTLGKIDVLILTLGTSWAYKSCLLYTSPSPRDQRGSRMPSSA